MKTYRKTSQRWLMMIGMAGSLSLLLSSCLKTNNSLPPPPFAYVSVIQASPDAPASDFYLDNNKVNTQPFNYGAYIDYFQAKTGKRTAYFYNTGTTSQLLASDTLTLKDQGVYSIFLANKISSPDFVVLTDSIARPSNGTASIRFVNVSADAPAVDLAQQGGNVLVSNIAYKGNSPFVTIPANQVNTFEIRQHGTNTVLATVTNANIVGGSVYTIWLHGQTTNPGSAPLTADIITNAYYN